MKKAILPVLFVLVLASALFLVYRFPECGIKLEPYEYANYHYSDVYGISSAVFFGLDWCESMNGRMTNHMAGTPDKQWIYNNAYWTIIKEDWVRTFPDRKDLEKQYGREIYYCVGRKQVLYLGARTLGFRGSPRMLGTNEMTNTKYSGMVLIQKLRVWPNIYDAISAYNKGHCWKTNGQYVNLEYMNNFKFVYTNRMPGGFYE